MTPTYLVVRSTSDAIASWFTGVWPALAIAIGVVVVASLFVDHTQLRIALLGLGSIILVGAAFVASRSTEADTLTLFLVPALLVVGTAALLLIGDRPRPYIWSLAGLGVVVTIGVGLTRLVIGQTGAPDAAVVAQALISSLFLTGWPVPLLAAFGRRRNALAARSVLALSGATAVAFGVLTWWAWLDVAAIPIAGIALILVVLEGTVYVLLGLNARDGTGSAEVERNSSPTRPAGSG
jgi:hypothetical protein